jgi:hypothetical protein
MSAEYFEQEKPGEQNWFQKCRIFLRQCLLMKIIHWWSSMIQMHWPELFKARDKEFNVFFKKK